MFKYMIMLSIFLAFRALAHANYFHAKLPQPQSPSPCAPVDAEQEIQEVITANVFGLGNRVITP